MSKRNKECSLLNRILKGKSDKRHKSSSSLAGVDLEGTRSERKLETKGTIPEADDQFGVAEARCEDLKENINKVRSFRKKRKLKKTSMTRVNEQPIVSEDVPSIAVRTTPKKMSERARQLETPAPSSRSYVDPATVEQHQMLGQVWGYGQDFKQHTNESSPEIVKSKMHSRSARAHGDGMCGPSLQITITPPEEEPRYQDDELTYSSDVEIVGVNEEFRLGVGLRARQSNSVTPQKRVGSRRQYLEVPTWRSPTVLFPKPPSRTRRLLSPTGQAQAKYEQAPEDQPVEELFNKKRVNVNSPTKGPQEKNDVIRTNIPFVASKSTTPSHNIGVNIQQVLNGVKIQQPLSGIPATMAHHMGLRHVSRNPKRMAAPTSSGNLKINAIKLGRRMLILSAHKSVSYNRVLDMYKEGDGMVPRFLRAMSRPQKFFSSMQNLKPNREELEGAPEKATSDEFQASKQRLVEYSNLYKEFEEVEKLLEEGNKAPALRQRYEELLRELALREDCVRKLLRDTRHKRGAKLSTSPLRASPSTAEGYHHLSSHKMRKDDQQH